MVTTMFVVDVELHRVAQVFVHAEDEDAASAAARELLLYGDTEPPALLNRDTVAVRSLTVTPGQSWEDAGRPAPVIA